jgi:hypothetical protein
MIVSTGMASIAELTRQCAPRGRRVSRTGAAEMHEHVSGHAENTNILPIPHMRSCSIARSVCRTTRWASACRWPP